jgi:hypothetical protein
MFFDDYLIPPNLAELGLPRRGDHIQADLETIWETPYPVITSYQRTMAAMGIVPFGGGTRERQGERREGYILSGYRDAILNGNRNSPHRYAFAVDLQAKRDRQIEIGRKALTCGFSRVGLYAQRGFLHLDVAPSNWIAVYHKVRFWVQLDGKYHFFRTYEEAARFAADVKL